MKDFLSLFPHQLCSPPVLTARSTLPRFENPFRLAANHIRARHTDHAHLITGGAVRPFVLMHGRSRKGGVKRQREQRSLYLTVFNTIFSVKMGIIGNFNGISENLYSLYVDHL